MKIIITGTKGYIAQNLAQSLTEAGHCAELVDARSDACFEREFWGVDAIIHLAALVHQKNRPESEYTRVNARLTELLALKAKAEGVKSFVFMSTLAVYGLTTGHITPDTPPAPHTPYGRSKFDAERRLSALWEKRFTVLRLRCPMVYGPGCPGNYQALRKLALSLGRAPKIANERSMVFIGNLCRYVEACLREGVGGMRIPQDPAYANTAEMMRLILINNGREAKESRFMGAMAGSLPGAAKKAFGSLTADRALTDIGVDVEMDSLERAIELTEKTGPELQGTIQ